MRSGYSPVLPDGPACKTKWNQLLPDYKRIADYLCRTGRNVPENWDLTSADRKAEGLPRQFAQDIFEQIHDWFGNRPQIQPPRVRDLLAMNDRNYSRPAPELENFADEADSEPETEDPLNSSQAEPLDTTDECRPPMSPRRRPPSARHTPADTNSSPMSRPGPSRLP